ncbi:hypothetical protein E1293_40410 [Actinomadura darangshiensis]|uniref:Integral membrane protein n=1 Tax=Actinomadura darangshiensis TaxID=705336 RepID=A0A4R5A313_9ACTN|nr:hypothetical protein [Actinomadura darangshiensis]TDD65370.1 hypothetical protein E1293_40410 [Actinomadura darangshiensis]
MTNVLAAATIAVALLAACYALVTALRGRAMGVGDLAALGVLEVLLVAQAVVAFVKLSGGEGPDGSATFVGYLLGSLLIPVAGAGWGLLERTRWGPGVIVVAGVAVAVMIVRMNQLWSGTGV